jgi:hypothetical protein
MALPTVVGVGAGTSGTGAITPAYPGGYTAVADDVAITPVETESTDTLVPPTNWAHLTNQVVTTGTTTKLWLIWRRLTTSEAAPTIAAVTNHMGGRMIVVRGCKNTGNPWDGFFGTTEVVADTTVSIPGLTTSVNDCLVLAAFGTGQDTASTAGATGWTNASLANLTERMDNWVIAGSGGGFAMATGEKAAAGVVSATTATLSLAANFKTLIVVALAPLVAAPETTHVLIRGNRPSETTSTSGPYSQPSSSMILGG